MTARQTWVTVYRAWRFAGKRHLHSPAHVLPYGEQCLLVIERMQETDKLSERQLLAAIRGR